MKNQKLCWLACIAVILFSCKQQHKVYSSAKQDFSTLPVKILPYRGFDTGLIHFVKNEVISFYNCNVTVLPETDLPVNSFYAPRQRYKADTLLVFQKNLAENAAAVIGLTDKDISTRNGEMDDWGVFGLGYNPGKACVISIYRLKRASATMQQLKERLSKVALHELGHNLGLPHCNKDITCLMNDAHGTISQVDREKKWLCDNCKKLLSDQ